MTDLKEQARNYASSCRTTFWQEVLSLECAYLAGQLADSQRVLSVGCGPAYLEAGLAEREYLVTGIDISFEILTCAPSQVHTAVAQAEALPFPAESFDAVIFVTSLEFIRNPHKALAESVTVLRARGKLIIMLLNTSAPFVMDKLAASHSYLQRLKHRDLREIQESIPDSVRFRTEYFMGVRDKAPFITRDPECAVLYAIVGEKVVLRTKETSG